MRACLLLSSPLLKKERELAWKEMELLLSAEAMQATCMTPPTPTGRHAIDTMALLLGWHSGSQAARAATKARSYTPHAVHINAYYDIGIQMSQDIP
jgi:hypothetical protein